MPPYSANKSKSQQRLMFAKAERGEVSKADAVGRARASKGKDLPERVEKKKHASLAAILLKLAEAGDDSGDGDDQDASPEDDWIDEKPKEKVSFVLAAALAKLAGDMIDDVAPPSAIEGKQKPLNPTKQQPVKGLDSDNDIAVEKKMHTEPLKGAQPLPKNFQWPSGKKSAP